MEGKRGAKSPQMHLNKQVYSITLKKKIYFFF